MKYQRIINLLDNSPNQPARLRTKNWVEINYYVHGKYNTKSQIKFNLQFKIKFMWWIYTCEWNYNIPKHRDSSKPKQ